MAVYLDNNATTPLRPEVWEAMARVEFGPDMLRNPSSVHQAGVAAQRVLAAARTQVAAALGATRDEIVFTGGGSEAINLALKGAVWAAQIPRPHVIATTIEHHAVLHALDWLRSTGADTTLVPVDSRGLVDPAALAGAITDRTVLVSVMHVNNETGAIQSVEAIGALCRERGVLFHVDAIQSVGKLPVDVGSLGCHLLSCSAHKLGGPRGVGALVVRAGTPLVPLVHGGAQEHGLRAGTENVQGIVGFATTLGLAEAERERNWAHWLALRPILYRLQNDLPAVRLNSDPACTVPNCVNMSFMQCDGMTLAMNLSARGIYVSTGSACTSGDTTPSHVLKAMGLSDEAALSALRFSMGTATTAAELERAVAETVAVVTRMRSLAASSAPAS
jgi:cysteine desulfurase